MKLLLQQKIEAGFGVALACLLLSGALSWWTAQRNMETFRAVDHTYQVLDQFQNILAETLNTETGGRGFVMSGDETFLTSYHVGITEAVRTFEMAKKLTQENPSHQRRLAALEPLVKAKISFVEDIVKLRRSGDTPGAIQMVNQGQGEKTMDDIRKLIGEMELEEGRLLQQRTVTAQALAHRTIAAVVFGSLLAIGLLGYATAVVRRDFEKRRVAEEALRSSEEKLASTLRFSIAESQRTDALLKTGALQSAIFNSANFSSIATDAKGVIQIFNVGAERMLGYTAADVLNKITPADISDPQELIVRAKALSVELGTPIMPGFEALVFKAARGIEDIYELTYIRKDGSRFPAVVSVAALRDVNDHGGIIGYLLIGTDNTVRKQVEADQKKLDQRLRDQQFYTRSLIESKIDALMTTDPAGIITDVNKQMEALTGCTRDELIGAPFKDCFTDPNRAEAGIKLVLSEKKVANYELTARARDGNETVVSYNAATFYDRERKLQGVFASARDVTELKRFEQSIQEANRMKSEFLANMSHELRTPLNGIIGFAEFLSDGKPGPLNPKQKEYLGDILNSGKHLLQLINDVLDLAKVEAGKVDLNPENFILTRAIEEVCAVATPLAQKKRIIVTLSVSPELGTVMLDPQKFKQVLYNLLSNAIKFTDEGGTVLITATPLDGERFKLSVKDTGIGIKPEDLKRLFREFEQLESGASRRYEGTGLGLALTRKIVELQGGTIGVESKVGHGSTFSVVLPLTTKADKV